MALHDYFPGIVRPPPARFVTEAGQPVHGMLAEFDGPAGVYHAAEKVRDAGYSRWDVHTPFPIHGIEDAMGVRRTILPVIMALGAFTGVFGALLMQWWMTSVDFPLVVQGKPYDAWEPWTPVTFELGVLLSAFTALISMLALNGLPRYHHPLFHKDRFLRSGQDRFFICVEASDPKFDPHRTRRLRESAGALDIDLVEE
jgi:hypothetical protein